MSEVAVAVAFTGEEIIEIACQEFRKRLRGLSPLQSLKEYVGFQVSFHTDVKLFKMAQSGGGDKQTLAWGNASGGDTSAAAQPADAASDAGQYTPNEDVNQERLDHDLPLTVETGDGRGGKVRKKVKVKK